MPSSLSGEEETSTTAGGPEAGPDRVGNGIFTTLLRRSQKKELLDVREAAFVLLLFLIGVILWSFGAVAVELLLGGSLLTPHTPRPSPSIADALWHLGTAFLLVLPTRHRVAIALAPALALGLDFDHLFGSVFPAVVGRQAHALLFVVLIGVALYLLRGRPAALLAAGAVLAHIGVDGGGFPLFSPASTALTGLTGVEQVAFCGVGALLFLAAVTPNSEIPRPRTWVPLVAVVAVLAVVLALGWPYIVPFTRV
ncbi:MAG: hypothetical protein L3J96_05500 [Thermoplasmata archaeon]|nr:hypothetical protein [Thermoplasmata archaeon]